MSQVDNYKTYRLVNGDETTEFTNSEEIKTELGEMVMNNSRISFTATEEDSETLVVECL
jgi:hypothetical protein